MAFLFFLFMIPSSPSNGTAGRLFFVIGEFPEYLHFYFHQIIPLGDAFDGIL